MNKNNSLYVLNYIKNIFVNLINSIYLLNNEVVCHINSENIFIFSKILKTKSELLFNQLIDLWGVDFMRKKNRFEVNYNLISLKLNVRLRIKLYVNNMYLNLHTVSNLYNSAGWLEREAWDMFGIFFRGHKDLRRILTDYGFEGFPLRKDFPLVGYSELYYSHRNKKLEYVPVVLVKKMNLYKNFGPWI